MSYDDIYATAVTYVVLIFGRFELLPLWHRRGKPIDTGNLNPGVMKTHAELGALDS